MKTLRRTVTPEHRASVIREAAEVIRAGGIAALPTETVYGLAARGDRPEAVARLVRLKERPPEKPFTLHVSDTGTAKRFASLDHPFVQKLAERYWPGPLTLVVPSREGPPAGLRVPGLALTREILQAAGRPVFLPSANPAGRTPACSPEEVLAYFHDRVELLVDHGATQIREPSTVVRVLEDRLEVLREGIISREDILNTACRKVLFVCTGNTCRSPMAEGLCKHLLAERCACPPEALPFRGYLIRSAGLAALEGEGASRYAVKVLERRKAGIHHHRTRTLTPALAAWADRIYVMTHAQREQVLALLAPPGRGSVPVELLDRRGRDILDPFGGSESVYARCAAQIYESLLEIVEVL